MKKEWKEPKLEVLSIEMTMAGPGLRYPDAVQTDPDPEDAQHYS
ncbi:paeninodin family lasso peptide [Neobacillus drentensis]